MDASPECCTALLVFDACQSPAALPARRRQKPHVKPPSISLPRPSTVPDNRKHSVVEKRWASHGSRLV
ncbi:hypothetical protein LMH87_005389 [Akanthomyces muscarius]|uniref:Uncharacterized protein n=1 Tax=Akanthomyces muscarius TaxID=2231603 RepID=A0A9W8QLP3_AKAMU|nr:hypothetical protein LMH87_005389 [Akanthomyces muscarius]KAJ4163678.1 hypothetical protein LMH87_005389 [Akanthomyces muscarius]